MNIDYTLKSLDKFDKIATFWWAAFVRQTEASSALSALYSEQPRMTFVYLQIILAPSKENLPKSFAFLKLGCFWFNMTRCSAYLAVEIGHGDAGGDVDGFDHFWFHCWNAR